MKKSFYIMLFATATVLLTTALPRMANAVEGRLVGLGSMNQVLVWRDRSAQNEGLRLISAGILDTNPALLLPLLSCIVPTRTRAIVTSAGLATHDILVIEGADSGCRGNIPVEAFSRR